MNPHFNVPKLHVTARENEYTSLSELRMCQFLHSCSKSYGVERLDHKATAQPRQPGRIVCSLYKRQDCRATDLKYKIKMQIMVKVCRYAICYFYSTTNCADSEVQYVVFMLF